MKSGDGRIRINREVFQNPNYKRHDSFGYNYRMPEVAAALGLAQTERIEFFINLRIKIAEMFFRIDTTKIQHERTVYRFMDWLGDIGGISEVISFTIMFIFGEYFEFGSKISIIKELYSKNSI